MQRTQAANHSGRQFSFGQNHVKRGIGTLVCVVASLAATTFVSADVVEYEVTFDASWSRETHPDAYPSGAHWSGLIGATHNSDAALWRVGELASQGIENMAETGSKNPLQAEIRALIDAGQADTLISGSGIGRSPGSASRRFSASSTHPLASVVSMIAPSPDWFVGVDSLPLRESHRWLPEIQVSLFPYDAGTDSGPQLTSPNQDTNPAELIHSLTQSEPFADTPALGTFTFRLLSTPGDVNDSGALDVDDVQAICDAVGMDSVAHDFTDDGVVSLADVEFWVGELAGTQLGDVDLNGEVGFDDFLTLSQNFGGEAGFAGGDTDCDGHVGFGDFLNLSRNFGGEAANVAAVPEPTGLGLLATGVLLCCARRRRR